LTPAADEAHEAVRSINHLTSGHAGELPAPVVHAVLGSLKRLGSGLEQASGQLAAGLRGTSERFDLTEDDPARDPAERVDVAVDALELASMHARRMGCLLDRALNGRQRRAPGGVRARRGRSGGHGPTPHRRRPRRRRLGHDSDTASR